MQTVDLLLCWHHKQVTWLWRGKLPTREVIDSYHHIFMQSSKLSSPYYYRKLASYKVMAIFWCAKFAISTLSELRRNRPFWQSYWNCIQLVPLLTFFVTRWSYFNLWLVSTMFYFFLWMHGLLHHWIYILHSKSTCIEATGYLQAPVRFLVSLLLVYLFAFLFLFRFYLLHCNLLLVSPVHSYVSSVELSIVENQLI